MLADKDLQQVGQLHFSCYIYESENVLENLLKLYKNDKNTDDL